MTRHPSSSRRLGAVILSAGASRRMGSPKALLDWHGRTILDQMIERIRPHCDEVVVVLGHHAGRIRATARRLAEVQCVVNPEPDRGQLSSLQTGLGALAERVDAALFTPVDLPALRPETVAGMARLARETSADLIVPRCRNRRGHPVCVSRALIAELLALSAEGDARQVIRRHLATALYLDTADPGILADVDEPADYEALLREAQP